MTLPQPRRSHTLSIVKNKPIICGGLPSSTTNCIIFDGGQWKVYANLNPAKEGHTSWVARNENIFLIGADNGNAKSTTIIQAGPEDAIPRPSETGFTLQNDAA